MNTNEIGSPFYPLPTFRSLSPAVWQIEHFQFSQTPSAVLALGREQHACIKHPYAAFNHFTSRTRPDQRKNIIDLSGAHVCATFVGSENSGTDIATRI